MAITAREVAAQYAWLYSDDAIPTPKGIWDEVVPTPACYVGIKHLSSDTSLVCFRGSVTMLDWLRDFQADAIPMYHPHLGWVHNGFLTDVLSNVGYLNNLAHRNVFIAGHSKGAGDGLIYGGLRLGDGLPVLGAYLFGSPRAGGPRLTEVWSKTPLATHRNMDSGGHDKVTDVPFAVVIDGAGIQYQQPRSFIDVTSSPWSGDAWGPFCYHHFWLYCQALGISGPQIDAIKPKGYQ